MSLHIPPSVKVGTGISILLVTLLWLGYSPAGRNSMTPHASHLAAEGRNLFYVASRMAEDYQIRDDEAGAWPGELALRQDRHRVTSVRGYMKRLIKEGYLTEDELAQLMVGPGLSRWHPAVEPFSGKKHCPFKFYRVTDQDTGAHLFLATRNFTYGGELDHTQPPIIDGQWYPMGSQKAIGGGHRYPLVVVHMDGTATNFKEILTKSPEKIGLLPGRKAGPPGTMERVEDTLAQH